MFVQAYINTAILIIQSYKGQVPFSIYLKNYFAQHKKHGSRDRKCITQLCYAYYRLGNALQNILIEKKILAAIFLSNNVINAWYNLFDDDWKKQWETSIDNKIAWLQQQLQLDTAQIFSWHNELSNEMDSYLFTLYHLQQPNLFVRIRPNKHKAVIEKLQALNIDYVQTNDCLTLKNSTKINEVFSINKEVIIQDYSSQQIASFLQLISKHNTVLKVWDCCAASGGKSILAKDTLPTIQLTVSDIRESILHNLRKRFLEAAVNHQYAFVADLNTPKSHIQNAPFGLIICDVPCTGSGTWGRNPENLSFFTANSISTFASLQKNITSNVVKHLQNTGYLLYITCSVFKQENEEVVEYLKQNFHFSIIKMEVIKGYENKADTMFAALLQKL